MIEQTFYPDGKIEISFSKASYAEYSFCISQGVCWLLGKGVNTFSIKRKTMEMGENKSPLENCSVTPLTQPRNLVFNQVTRIGDLVKESYFPRTLEEVWKSPIHGAELKEGHERISSAIQEFSLLDHYQLDPNTTIAEMAYGVADSVMTFFYKGATWYTYQASLARIQMKFDKGFQEKEIKSIIGGSEPGYRAFEKVDLK